MEKDKEQVNSDTPSFLSRRQQDISFKVSTKMRFNPQSENESAGIALIQNNNHQFRLEHSLQNGKKVIMFQNLIGFIIGN